MMNIQTNRHNQTGVLSLSYKYRQLRARWRIASQSNRAGIENSAATNAVNSPPLGDLANLSDELYRVSRVGR